jgi:hypothetical protein
VKFTRNKMSELFSEDDNKKFEHFTLVTDVEAPYTHQQQLVGPSSKVARGIDAEQDAKLNTLSTFGDGVYGELLEATCLPVANPDDSVLDDDDDDDENEAGGEAQGRKKRLCRFPGCVRVIKSQGHCQRHGARAKRCRVIGCDKQAQGTHDGMCKRHWKDLNFPQSTKVNEKEPPLPEGESIYDTILPQSVAFRPSNPTNDNVCNKRKPVKKESKKGASAVGGVTDTDDDEDDKEPPEPPKSTTVMPLVRFLSDGRSKPAGWHRASERRARGLFPVPTNGHQLEPWEKQLALVEILLLAGGTPYANFRHLGHAWGREKGFHLVLANSVFERRGDIDRKRRSDAGKVLSDEKKAIIREKTVQTRATGGSTTGSGGEVTGKSSKQQRPISTKKRKRDSCTTESGLDGPSVVLASASELSTIDPLTSLSTAPDFGSNVSYNTVAAEVTNNNIGTVEVGTIDYSYNTVVEVAHDSTSIEDTDTIEGQDSMNALKTEV